MFGSSKLVTSDRFREWYVDRVEARLDVVYADEVTDVSLDVDNEGLVIFSDHHKGAQDGADDFWRCEPAYCAALGYYEERGYRLCVLGDGEELWECEPNEVTREYTEVFALENEFQKTPGRYLRCWGNHDSEWSTRKNVEEHLFAVLPGVEVRSAFRLKLLSGQQELGNMLLIHGHQGTIESEQFADPSKWLVRHAWRPIQRRLKTPSTTAATDWRLRDAHSTALYAWAAKRAQAEKLVVVAGHTHKPVFSSPGSRDELQRHSDARLAELEQSYHNAPLGSEERACARAALEATKAKSSERATPALRDIEMEEACYFNTGCCSFGDGSISGLEVADGKIRLVSWPWPQGVDRPSKVTLEEAHLNEVFGSLPATNAPTEA
ncbi:MAG: hypothetical protein M3454_18605 [Actinomycetota bacterium]|nr:hypothetical protein [Actinomycetota bacterium]